MKTQTDTWTFQWYFDEGQAWDSGLRERWEAVHGGGENFVFFEPRMVRLWYECYQRLRTIKPAFLWAENGSVRLFWPLVLDRSAWRRGGFWSLRPAGFYEFDYHDPITDRPLSGEQWSGFYRAFGREFKKRFRWRAGYVWIPRLYRGGEVIEGEAIEAVGRAPYIDLTQYESWEDYLGRCSKPHRQDVRRQIRRLREQGELELVRYDSEESGEELEESLGKHLERHQGHWPGATRARDWHRRLVKELSGAGLVDFSVLRCGGRMVSSHLGYQWQGRTYYYMPSYDPEMANYSPGKVHLALLIEEAMGQGKDCFDLLSGAEEYKYLWTSDEVVLRQYQYDRIGLRAAVLRWYRGRR